MNVDPVELFGEERMSPGARDSVIEELQRLPISANFKRRIFIRWSELVNVPYTDTDLRRVTLKPPF